MCLQYETKEPKNEVAAGNAVASWDDILWLIPLKFDKRHYFHYEWA